MNYLKQDKQDIDAANSSLTIVQHNNGFAFFISQKPDNILLYEKINFSNNSNPIEILQKALTEPFYQNNFLEVQLIVKGKRISMVPEAFKLNTENYKNLDFDYIPTEEDIFENKIKGFAYVYFPIASQMVSILRKKFNDIVFLHHETLFFSQCFFNLNKELGQIYMLNIKEKYFSAFIAENGKIKIANNYGYDGKDDFGYFAMGLVQNFGLNQYKLNMVVSGNIMPDSVLYILIEKYISNISLESTQDLPTEVINETVVIKHLQSENN